MRKSTVPATIPEDLRKRLAMQARARRVSLAHHAGLILEDALAERSRVIAGTLLLAGTDLDRAAIAARLGVEAATVDRILDIWNGHLETAL